MIGVAHKQKSKSNSHEAKIIDWSKLSGFLEISSR